MKEKYTKGSLDHIPIKDNVVEGNETFRTLISGQEAKVIQIDTHGSMDSPGEWYDQDEDEWVLLIRGSAMVEFFDGEIVTLNEGEYLYIPAGLRHRVFSTSREPHCRWLAVHGKLNKEIDGENRF